MGYESFVSFAGSSFPAKLFLEIILGILAFRLGKNGKTRTVTFLYACVVLLLGRDLLGIFIPGEFVYLVSDIALFVVFLFAFRIPDRVGKAALVFLALNCIVIVFFIANYSFSFELDISPAVSRIFLIIEVIAFALLYGVAEGKREGSSEDSSAETMKTGIDRQKVLFLAGYLLYAFIVSVLGYENTLTAYFIVPLSYILPSFLVLHFSNLIEEKREEERVYYSRTIGSVYDFLESTSEPFKTGLAMEELLDRANQVLVAETNADGGVLFLVDEFDDVIAARSYYGKFPPPFKLPNDLPRKPARVETFVRNAQFKVGETIFGEVAQTGKAVLVVDAKNDSRIFVNEEEEFLSFKSLIIAPFVVGGRTIGLMAVVKKTDAFTGRDFDRCKVLADFAALVVNNLLELLERSEKTDIEREAAIAADIQKTLLPKKLPEYKNLAFGVFSLPAKGVCGDYYDIIQNRKDRLTLVIGDVAGKGIPSSLVMVMIRSILHLVTNTDRDSATILNWVNRGVTGKIDVDHYATLSVLSINPERGEIEYSNASHQPMMIYRRASRNIETIEMKSVPIGVERKTEFKQINIKLDHGDILLLYTDGLVEAMNDQGKQYGRKSLGNIVMKNRDLTAKEIAAKVKSDLQEFIGQARQHDDQSLLVLKAKL